MPAETPLIANPNWCEPAKYKPVTVSPKKFKDGAAADPLPRVNELMKLDVEVCEL
jgi:hypothetical protein